jgi:exonuclease III
MLTQNLKNNILNARILASVVHSDHCPVLVDMDI